MTPSERLVTALRGGRPDRVPFVPKIWVDYAAAHLGVPLRRVVEDPVTALEVILRAGADLELDAVRQFPLPARRTVEADGRLWEVAPSTGRRLGPIDLAGGLHTLVADARDWRLDDPVNVAFFHHRRPPGPAVTREADAAALAVPDGRLLDDLGLARNQAAAFARAGWAAGPGAGPRKDCGAAAAAGSVSAAPRAESPAVIQDCGPVGLSFLVALNGMDRALLGLLDEPRLAHAALERGDAIAIARGSYWLDRGWRVLRINDSAGNLSVISPATWREFVAPHLATVVAELHRRCPDALLYCHVCGNTLPIIGDLAATGLDAIAPLDPLGGFTVADARRALDAWMAQRAGDPMGERAAGRAVRRPALMGGINTLSFVDGTPESVAAEATACIAGARGPGEDDRAVPALGVPGAYVLGSGCVVPRGARAACLRAARDAARDAARACGATR